MVQRFSFVTRQGRLLGLFVGLLGALGCQDGPEQGDGPAGEEDELGSCGDRRAIAGCAAGDLGTKDVDGDGVSNCRDPDIDGDGLENGRDCAPYDTPLSLASCEGDQGSKDYDADGTRNCRDPDIDGDGIENEHDGSPYDAEGAPANK
jgi:hypothetical protein